MQNGRHVNDTDNYGKEKKKDRKQEYFENLA
jgi:hypothetical protein